uniref:Type IV pilus biogenesis protein PilP n=1 Tax=Pseudomonas fluorescens (strain SBW25) TaxID=216595 RepID=A0A0G4E458_PSEFS|nr:hypothetical protein [Pseudomonas fluorescens]CEK42031.1 hypothetical protein PQBR57_0078 [Pseudomonas fluorescens SBW25]
MNKLSLITLALGFAFSTGAFAEGADDDLLARNHTLSEMQFTADKLAIQASMAKSYKDMSDARFIVDPRGVPLGIGDMETLAMQVRLRAGMQDSKGESSSDPFGGSNPIIPMPPGQGMFGDAGFPTGPAPAPASPAAKVEPKADKVEVIEKPSEREKVQGKQVLRLVELRGTSATLFTNDGFKELAVGQSVYDQKLTHIGADSVTLKGKEGSRTLRIDWSKSVRYSDD